MRSLTLKPTYLSRAFYWERRDPEKVLDMIRKEARPILKIRVHAHTPSVSVEVIQGVEDRIFISGGERLFLNKGEDYVELIWGSGEGPSVMFDLDQVIWETVEELRPSGYTPLWEEVQ